VRTFLIVVGVLLLLMLWAGMADDGGQPKGDGVDPADDPPKPERGTKVPSTPKPRSAPKPRRRPDAHDGLLYVERIPDVWRPDDDPEALGLPVTALQVSGDVYVEYNDFPTTVIVRMFDVTEGSEIDERYAIGCDVDELHDENGFFEYTQDFHTPFQDTTFTDFAVGAIPDFALTLPKRGRRRVMVYVLFAPTYDLDEVFSYGSVEFDMDFDRVGYLEWEEHALQQEEHLVRIFVAASAIDGTIERSEIDAIKTFFSTRYEGREDAKKWKSSATATLRETVEDLKENRTTPGKLLNAAAKEILEADEPEVSRAAYEVAVRAVAADGAVNAKEEALLSKLALALQIDDDVVRELRDRNLRASMFEHLEDEVILGMPHGLDDDEKRSWLATEYGKWRGRVSHSNPDVASEASIRLERIAKLRTSLG